MIGVATIFQPIGDETHPQWQVPPVRAERCYGIATGQESFARRRAYWVGVVAVQTESLFDKLADVRQHGSVWI